MAILGSVEYSTGRKSANQYRPRPKHIQIPFQKIFPPLIRLTHFFNQKNQFFGHFTKISIFGQVLFLLFLLLFGVPQCCFFKSMIFQLSFAQKIIIISFLDQKLCQFEIWSIPCYLVIFDVIAWEIVAFTLFQSDFTYPSTHTFYNISRMKHFIQNPLHEAFYMYVMFTFLPLATYMHLK